MRLGSPGVVYEAAVAATKRFGRQLGTGREPDLISGWGGPAQGGMSRKRGGGPRLGF